MWLRWPHAISQHSVSVLNSGNKYVSYSRLYFTFTSIYVSFHMFIFQYVINILPVRGEIYVSSLWTWEDSCNCLDQHNASLPLSLSPSLWEPRATLKLLCWKDHMNKSYKEMPKDPQLFWAPSVLVFPVQALDSWMKKPGRWAQPQPLSVFNLMRNPEPESFSQIYPNFLPKEIMIDNNKWLLF